MRLIDQLYRDNIAGQPILDVFEQRIQKSDIEIAYWIADECLQKSETKEEFEKAWSSDLQKRFPSGSWRTINGSHVFIHDGKVIAGLGGFNKQIDEFFEGKKGKSNIDVAKEKRKENIISGSKEKIDNALKEGGKVYVYEKKSESKTKQLEQEYQRLGANAPIGNQNHPETKRFNELRKLKQEGKLEVREPQYRIERPDGHIMILNKTEYEYAKEKQQSQDTKKEVYELTKNEFTEKQDKLKKDWKSFWNASNKGTKLTDEIINKYPLQVAGFLRESYELGGVGYTDTSYLARNKNKSDKMMAIKEKYNLNMQDINIMFGSDKYHENWVKDALLMGKKVPENVLKEYHEIAKKYQKK